MRAFLFPRKVPIVGWVERETARKPAILRGPRPPVLRRIHAERAGTNRMYK